MVDVGVVTDQQGVESHVRLRTLAQNGAADEKWMNAFVFMQKRMLSWKQVENV